MSAQIRAYARRLVAAAGLLVAGLAVAAAVRTWRAERSFAHGAAARRRGDFADADAAFRAAGGRGNADAAIEGARLALLRRDWGGAERSLREALALAPARATPQILLALLEVDRPGAWDVAREERAMSACRSAVAREPGRSANWTEAGGVLLRLAALRRSAWDPERIRSVSAAAAADFAAALAREPQAARAVFTRMLEEGADAALLVDVASRQSGRNDLPALASVLAARGERALALRAAEIAARLHGQEAQAAAPLLRAAGTRR